jgi:hypothetical protein
VLEQAGPYLKTYKAKRAKLVLRRYVRLTPRNGKYTQAQLMERERFIEEFMQLNPRRTSRSPQGNGRRAATIPALTPEDGLRKV